MKMETKSNLIERKSNLIERANLFMTIFATILAIIALVCAAIVESNNGKLREIVDYDNKAQTAAVEIAKDNKDWFDYCYDINVNYDEDNSKRYKISFLYTVVNDSNEYQTVYLVSFKGNRTIITKVFDTRG